MRAVREAMFAITAGRASTQSCAAREMLDVTSANRAIRVGPEVIVPSEQYVWDLSNVNSAMGNSTTDSVPVVMFLVP